MAPKVDSGKKRSLVEDFHAANPPFFETSAGRSGGKWVRQSLNLGLEYFALLLPREFLAATTNGFGELIDQHKPRRVYLCRFRIDFRGDGARPQTNCWYALDRPKNPELLFLDDGDPLQTSLLGAG